MQETKLYRAGEDGTEEEEAQKATLTRGGEDYFIKVA